MKQGDRVKVRKTKQHGIIIRVVGNPYLPGWLVIHRYHVNIDGMPTGEYESYKCYQLKLEERK